MKQLLRMISLLLVALILAAGIPSALADSVSQAIAESTPYRYELLTNGTIAITGYADTSVQELVLPRKLKDRYVTAISDGAFEDLTALHSLTVPACVGSIGGNIFAANRSVHLKGYSGTAIEALALEQGLPFDTLSEMELMEGVLDLSEMNANEWQLYSNETLLLRAPYCDLVQADSRVYLPRCDAFPMGYGVALSDLRVTAEGVKAKYTSLDFGETISHFHIENETFIPDWSRAEWAEGVTISEPDLLLGASELEITAGLPGFSFEKSMGSCSISGTIAPSLNLNVTLDYSLGSINYVSVDTEAKITGEAAISAELKAKASRLNKKTKIDLATIPVVSLSGMCTILASVGFSVDIEGELSLVFDLGLKHSFSWDKETGLHSEAPQFLHALDVEAKLSLEIGPYLKYYFTVGLPVKIGSIPLSIKMMTATLSLVAGAEVTTGEKDKLCLDRTVYLRAFMDLHIGITEWNLCCFDGTLCELKIPIPSLSKHYEHRTGKWQDKCDLDNEEDFDVSYVSDGNVIVSVKAANNSPLVEPKGVKKNGFELLGWLNGDKMWDFADNVTGDMTLIAVWAKTGDEEDDPIGEIDPAALESGELPEGYVCAWDVATFSLVDPVINYAAIDTYYSSFPRYIEENRYTYSELANAVNKGWISWPQKYEFSVGSKNVVIPSSLFGESSEYMEDFWGYTAGSVIFCNGITSIPDGCFQFAGSLKYVYLPDTVTRIGAYAFLGCANLSSIEMSSGLISIGEKAFCMCEKLTSIILPDTVTTIDEYAFSGCRNLNSVKLSKNLKSIGYRAFENCSSLKSITLPDGLTTIMGNVFEGCHSLENINIPGSLESIGQRLFDGCPNLDKIVIRADQVPGSFAQGAKMHTLEITSPIKAIDPHAIYLSGLSGNIDELIILSGDYPSYDNDVMPIVDNVTKVVIGKDVDPDSEILFCDLYGLREAWIYSDIDYIKVMCAGDYRFAPASLTDVYLDPDSRIAAGLARDYPEIHLHPLDPETKIWLRFDTGSGSIIPSQHLKEGDYADKPDDPFRDGYRFTGWYTDPYLTREWRFMKDTMPGHTITLYAGWEEAVSEPSLSDAVEGRIEYIDTYESSYTIPAEVDGQTVTSLGEASIPPTVEYLVIPSSVQYIEPGAFRDADRLEYVYLESNNGTSQEGLHKDSYGNLYNDHILLWGSLRNNNCVIADGTLSVAAYAIKNVDQISMPSSIRTLDANAISDCDGTVIRFECDPQSIDPLCFSNCDDLDIYGPIDAPVLTAFADAHNVRYNEYPLYFQYDRSTAFNVRAGSLLPNIDASLLGIENAEWYYDSDLTHPVDFDHAVMPAGSLYLYGCRHYGDFLCNDPYTDPDYVSIIRYVGDDEEVTVPEAFGDVTVEKIESRAFANTNIKTIALPDDVQIASDAFEGTDLQLILVKKSSYTGRRMAELFPNVPQQDNSPSFNGFLYDIEERYYYEGEDEETEVSVEVAVLYAYVGNAQSVTIPESIEGCTLITLDKFLFANSPVKEVTIKKDVWSFSYDVFSDSNVDTVYLGKSIQWFADFLHEEYPKIKVRYLDPQEEEEEQPDPLPPGDRMTLPAGLTQIDMEAFAGNTAISGVRCPNGMEAICAGAFGGCVNLQWIAIPRSVNQIDESAFEDCAGLTIYAPNGCFAQTFAEAHSIPFVEWNG